MSARGYGREQAIQERTDDATGLRPWEREYQKDVSWLLSELAAARKERDEASDALQALAADHYFARAEAAEDRAVRAEAAHRKLSDAARTLDGLLAHCDAAAKREPREDDPDALSARLAALEERLGT